MIDLAKIGIQGRRNENLKNVIGSLKIFNQASKDQEVAGNICPMTTVEVKPGKKWETLPVVIDSGATVPVFNPKTATAYQLMENDASRQGHEYELASGDSIPCLGEKRIAVLTKEGTVRGYSSNCADVQEAINSLNAGGAGNGQSFHRQGS